MTARAALVLSALALLGGCAGTAGAGSTAACPRAGGGEMVKAELLFGRDVAGRAPVSDAEWERFVAEEVTPRFPDGLTVFAATGQWRDRATAAVVREPSFVVQIVAPASAEADARLAAIRSAYRQRFNQQSVGLVLTSVCAAF